MTPTDESLDSLRSAIGRLLSADRRQRGRDQHRRGGTLSYAQLRGLFVLTREDEATLGTLAKEAELNPASVTTMVDQLEAAGLVRRRRDSQDRRQCWVSLTDAGRQQVAEKERYWRAKMAVAYSDITPDEMAAAIKVIERTATSMEQLGEEAPDEEAQAS